VRIDPQGPGDCPVRLRVDYTSPCGFLQIPRSNCVNLSPPFRLLRASGSDAAREWPDDTHSRFAATQPEDITSIWQGYRKGYAMFRQAGLW